MKIDSKAHIHMMSQLTSLQSSKGIKKKKFNIDIDTNEVSDNAEVTTNQVTSAHSPAFITFKNHPPLREALCAGEKQLDALRRIQYQLLSNQVNLDDLRQLKEDLTNSLDTTTQLPSKAQALLSDIQVRVAVELAKRT